MVTVQAPRRLSITFLTRTGSLSETTSWRPSSTPPSASGNTADMCWPESSWDYSESPLLYLRFWLCQSTVDNLHPPYDQAWLPWEVDGHCGQDWLLSAVWQQGSMPRHLALPLPAGQKLWVSQTCLKVVSFGIAFTLCLRRRELCAKQI